MKFIKSLLESSYQEVWKSLIRPPRDLYEDSELGQGSFKFNGKNFKRTDFSVYNHRNLKLECSHWEPYDEERELDRLPCVIYLPGNSSSRCEALPLLSYLLPLNITVFGVDFAGSGRSEGDYISLGYYEQDDVEVIVEYLRKSNKVSTIGLWGRSMGAVTAIIASLNSQEISCIVCDSPFSSLNKLIDEYIAKIITLPSLITNPLKKLVSDIIQSKANFRIEKIEPIQFAKNGCVSALFCHGLDDSFISSQHCIQLFNQYMGEKELVMFNGNHNTKRPYHILQIISLFFYDKLQVENASVISDLYNNKKFVSNVKNSLSIAKLEANQVDNEDYTFTTIKSLECNKNCKDYFKTEQE